MKFIVSNSLGLYMQICACMGSETAHKNDHDHSLEKLHLDVWKDCNLQQAFRMSKQ
jgi:hypothetical protein